MKFATATVIALCNGDICATPEENPDYQLCEGTVTNAYQDCVMSCINDPQCLSTCNREYVQNLAQCPCQEGCPDGCPCPDYECPVYEDALILNTYPAEVPNQPVIVGLDAGYNYELDFAYESGTEAFGSCSVLFAGDMLIFGGYNEPRQISRVDECRVKRLGTLEFDFFYGACANTGARVTLCFDEMNAAFNWCSMSDNPTDAFNWRDAESSQFEHRRIRIAASSEMLLAVGSYGDHALAEVMGEESGTWSSVATYPFHQSVSLAPVLNVGSPFTFYIIGGWSTTFNDAISTIARFDAIENKWTASGEMNKGRWAHGAVFMSGHFLIAGGKQTDTMDVLTEKCELGGNNVACVEQTPRLNEHMYYPEMFTLLDRLSFCPVV